MAPAHIPLAIRAEAGALNRSSARAKAAVPERPTPPRSLTTGTHQGHNRVARERQARLGYRRANQLIQGTAAREQKRAKLAASLGSLGQPLPRRWARFLCGSATWSACQRPAAALPRHPLPALARPVPERMIGRIMRLKLPLFMHLFKIESQCEGPSGTEKREGFFSSSTIL